jgi:23S rRNA (adenine2503-C2)-methyltransferase
VVSPGAAIEDDPVVDKDKPGLLDLSLEALSSRLVELGEKPYRAKQVYSWMHKRGVIDPHAMTDLSAILREKLAASFSFRPLKLVASQTSADGTVKFAWKTARGRPVEAVLMPSFKYGAVLCLSTQSGCALGCKFCQTGQMGHRSNLRAGEILAQLYLAEAAAGVTMDRVVLMGMGEPLLNLSSTKQAVEVLTSKSGREWAPRRITVSTVGLAKPMLELARSFPRVNLALSLHFTTNDARAAHMPKAEHDIVKLEEALCYYRQINGGKITLEYMLLAGLNDSDDDAQRLVRIARLAGIKPDSPVYQEAMSFPAPQHQQPLPLHVNLIEYNPIGLREYKPSSEDRINAFAVLLRDANVTVSVRHSRGRDIAAACGMLGSKS